MTTVILFATMVLSVVSLVMHFVAPRTDTTWDDKVEDVVDQVLEYLGQHDGVTGVAKETDTVTK